MDILSLEKLNEMLKDLMPDESNSIIVDSASSIRRHEYCYINAYAQRTEYHSEVIAVALTKELEEQMSEALQAQNNKEPYIRMDNEFLEKLKAAPSISTKGLFSRIGLKMNEFINGGRDVDHHHILLIEEDDRLAKNQPIYAVKAESKMCNCLVCNGTGKVGNEDKSGYLMHENCPECKGSGRVGLLTCFKTTVTEKQATITRCLDNEVNNLDIKTVMSHKTDDETRKRMLTRYNGIEEIKYDKDIEPYLDIIHDKIGENNAIEEIHYQIIPCYSFEYHKVLSGKTYTGVVIDPMERPEIILNLDGIGSKLFGGMRDSIKGINRFLGNIAKSNTFKDSEDLRRTTRLLIAVAVADGKVTEDEKLTMTQTIRGIDTFTTGEKETLVKLLNKESGDFLTDDDYKFHSSDNAKETLKKMQDLAVADGNFDNKEREIIEKLRLTV